MEDDKSYLEEQIKQLEHLAKHNPKLYKKKLCVFTMIGYLYIVMLLTLLIACIGIILFVSFKLHITGGAAKLVIILLGFVILLLRSLFVSIPKPQGIYIESEDAPKIFEIIDEIRNVTNAPKIHKVLITGDLNASIVQRPRLGIFGFNTSYLEIGIQLMMVLSEEELKSVLAHEIGHISSNHGKFGNWIYRMNSTWYNIRENFNNKNRKGIFLIKMFLDWYIPRYNIYSHVILRKQEYEADKFSIKVVGNKIAAESILNLIIKSNYIEKIFWPSIEKKAVDDSEPLGNIYNVLMDKLYQEEINEEFKIKSIRREISRKKDPFDTHPSLIERIKEMDIKVFVPKASNEMALTLLDEKMDEYVDVLNKKWQDDVEEVWEERYHGIQKCKEQLKEYEKQGGYYKLSKEDKLEFAYLHEIIKDDEEALKWYSKYIEEFPECEDANFFIGRLYIENDNLEGIKYIKKALEIDDTYALEGYELMHNILVENGQEEEAKNLYEKALEHSEYLYNIAEEKGNLDIDDEYISHNLKPDKLNDIVSQLKNNNKIKEAYLVRKKIKNSTRDKEFYILGILLDFHWYTDYEKYNESIDEISDTIEVEYDMVAMYLNVENRAFKDVFEEVENSKIYVKGKE